MLKKTSIILGLIIGCLYSANAQTAKDSTECVNTLKEILYLCKHVDFSDTNTIKLGTFYKVSPYIVYRGNDKNRAWKVEADYLLEEDKKGVDGVCLKLNRTINRDTSFTVLEYRTQTESEGTWHAIRVSYHDKEKLKTLVVAFLRIDGKLLLGDLD